MQVGTLPHSLDQWRSITSSVFVLNMVIGHHIQLRVLSPSFCDFHQFNIKVVLGHHPVIREEVQELLAKWEVGPQLVVLVSITVYWWFLSIQVVNILFSVLSDLITTCTSLLLGCLLLNMVLQCIQQGNYAFSLEFKDIYITNSLL